MAGALPPLHEIAKNVGVELPAYLVKLDPTDKTPTFEKVIKPKPSKEDTGTSYEFEGI